ncbi:UDP-N-acetylmuramate dehydrogenase [Acaricomes phytoseiuli]|uniref:UDP-N-acetylmuramate dehydrogenase n=1 Tax=Acaricomes phytoseiuli TaxID=291968 RepID=UPI0022222FF1|nr:UDP-N-acetylmuramate dehydrogenase [Acaricomes phytoseiuli]MCW1249736.1 UDP-N-acetylmuramate dehydrogenase [Acaricomes phytoseiuli]
MTPTASGADLALAELTTIGVGGPARRLEEAVTEAEIIDAVRAADAAEEPLLIIGGGSNLLISDAGFDGTVLRIRTSGIRTNSEDTCGGASVLVQAGQNWDEFVHDAVLHARSGVEALSGIPGATGATPVQNVGAYGSEVAHTIAAVRVWDRQEQQVRTFTTSELQFGYRDSVLKRHRWQGITGSPRYVVLTVEFQLPLSRMSAPIRYAELAARLDVPLGERASALDVREAVLELRGRKGMVLDAEDRDAFSTGSFFTNPVISEEQAAGLPDEAPRYPASGGVKLSAAWLIAASGFSRGFGSELTGGRASLSTKHTLAITNRGGADATDILAVARAVRQGVQDRFGIELEAESLLVGLQL